MPISKIFEAAERKEVFIGGREIYPNMLKHHCYSCILDFDKGLKEPSGADDESQNRPFLSRRIYSWRLNI